MKNYLILVRGLPGSGKSTLASEIAGQAFRETIHLETDQFWGPDYQFDMAKGIKESFVSQ